MTMGILDTPETDIKEFFQRQFGIAKKANPRKKKTRATKANELHQIVKAWRKDTDRFRAAWRHIDTEYRLGTEITENRLFRYSHNQRGDLQYEQKVAPARIYSLVHTVESMVLGNRPKMFLEGFTAQVEEDVRSTLETALNNEWQQDFDLYREARLCVRDCVKKGFAVMLSSYEATFDSAEQRRISEETRAQEADDPVLAEGARLAQASVATQDLRGAQEARRTNYEGYLEGKIISRRVDPSTFISDVDALSERDARVMGRMIWADLEYVKADDRFENTAGLEPTTRQRANQILERDVSEEHTSPFESVLLYELFVKQPDGSWDLYVIAEGHDEILLHEPAAYWVGCPYKILRWNEDGEHLIPISDAQAVLSEIHAERDLLTKLFEGYAREHSDTLLIDEQLGIEEQLNAANQAAVSKIIPATKPKDQPFQNLVYKVPKDTKSPDALNILATLERGIQISSGIGPNQFGQALKSGTSATEANEVASFARSRGGPKLAAVEEFISRVASDRLGLMAQHFEREDIELLVSPEAAEAWPTWTEADVQMGLRVIVDPGSTTQDSDQNRINQMITLLGVFNQDPTMRQLVDIPRIAQEIFERLGFREGSQFVRLSSDEFADLAAATDAAALAQGRTQTSGGSPPGVPGGTAEQQQAGGAEV